MMEYCYEKSGNLKLDLECFKLYLKNNFKSAKFAVSKYGDDLCLIHVHNNEMECTYHGKIYIMTIKGILGALSYECFKMRNKVVIHNFETSWTRENINRGIGTEVLKYMDEIAFEAKWKEIDGFLCESDLKMLGSMLYHFYKKNGFEITPDNRIYKNYR